MKMLVTILLAGALWGPSALAGALPRHKVEAAKTVRQLPFRPYQKRPDGIGAAAGSHAPAVTVATPQLPFRAYQKRPVGAPRAPRSLVVANRGN